MKLNKSGVNKLLTNARTLSRASADTTYQLSKIMSIMHSLELHSVIGYDSFDQMIASEMEFSQFVGRGLCNFHNAITRLKYSKSETIRMLQHNSWRQIYSIVASRDTKITVASVIRQLKTGGHGNSEFQFNFAISSDKQSAKLNSMLAHYGMVTTASGTRTHLSEAFEKMLEKHESLLRAEKRASAPGKRRLKAA
jgi:hypothetical protein